MPERQASPAAAPADIETSDSSLLDRIVDAARMSESAATKERGTNLIREFVAQVLVNEQPLATGTGYSKKKAEQSAAEKAFETLGLD